MKSILCLLITFVFLNSNTFAQKYFDNTLVNQIVDRELTEAYLRSTDQETKGDPYLYNDWLRGHLVKINGNASETMDIRFNTHENLIEFKFLNETYIASAKAVGGFVLNTPDGSRKLFRKGFYIPEEGIQENTFLEVLYDGKTKLLAYHYTQLIEGTSPDMFTGKVTSTYIDKKNYFISRKAGRLTEVKLKRKHLLQTLDGHDKQLRAYAKRHDLSFKKERDVTKILMEFDRLNANNQQ